MTDLELGLPMMSEQEIKIIDMLIEEHQSQHCLEWGSGNSTVYFSKHECIKSWLSIEHNGNYVQHLAPQLDLKSIIIWAQANEWYVDSVKHLGPRFDFILVDGLERESCLSAAMLLKTEDGIVLLHDADRPEYQEFLGKYRYEKLCAGEKEVPGGCAHRGLARVYELL